MRTNLLPVARKPINERIEAAYDGLVKRLGVEGAKREVARRVYGPDKSGRSREIARYMKAGAPTPRLPVAVQMAVALDQDADAFIDDPLVLIAQELDAANRTVEKLDRRLQELAQAVAEGFEASQATLGALSGDVAELVRRLPPEAEQMRQLP